MAVTSTHITSSTKHKSIISDSHLPTEKLVLNPKQAEIAAYAQLKHSNRGPTSVVKTGTLLAHMLNHNDKELRTERTFIEERPEDVVGILPFRIQKGELLVSAIECLRPALLARRHAHLPHLAEDISGRVINQIGGYLSNFDGLETAVTRTLKDKSGLSALSDPIFLGNVILTNPGVSSELEVPTAVEVGSREHKSFIVEGSGFNASRKIFEMSAQACIDRFVSGKLSDPRLLNVLDLHELLTKQGRALSPLHFPGKLKQQLQARLRAFDSHCNPVVALTTANEVAHFIQHAPIDDRITTSANVSRITEAPDHDLYQTYNLLVQNKGSKGQDIGAVYDAEAVVRKNDILNIIVLGKVGDKIVMPINSGARPALEVRDSTPHLIHTITGARNIEGVTTALTVPYTDKPKVNSLIAQKVKELTGHEIVGEPILSDIQGYLSPGFNTTGFRVAFAFIDITNSSCGQLPYHTALASPRALLDAGVRDLSLRTAARLVSLAFDMPPEKRSNLTPQLRQEFQKLMLSEGKLMHFIRERSPVFRALMKQNPTLANIITKRANDGGLEIEEREKSDPERFFFNSLMQSFMVHKGDHPLKVLQLLWHDFWHYEHPDPLPFVQTKAGLRACTFKEYLDVVMGNEIDAVVFSDIILPEYYGISKFEEETQSASLASLMKLAKINRLDDQREVVAQALLHGKVDPRLVTVLKRPAIFRLYEPIIREKFLGYYVRDTLKNVGILYKQWVNLKDVAGVAKRMGARLIGDDLTLPASFSARVDRLLHDADGHAVRTGRNPLKEALGYTKTYHIYERALRLRYVKRYISPDNKELHAKLTTIIKELVSTHNKLTKLASKVVSIEESSVNAGAFRALRKAQEGVVEKAKRLLLRIENDDDLLDARIRKLLKERKHAPFPVLIFDPRAEPDQQRRVDLLLKKAGILR